VSPGQRGDQGPKGETQDRREHFYNSWSKNSTIFFCTNFAGEPGTFDGDIKDLIGPAGPRGLTGDPGLPVSRSGIHVYHNIKIHFVKQSVHKCVLFIFIFQFSYAVCHREQVKTCHLSTRLV
jgi:hypothetical protein